MMSETKTPSEVATYNLALAFNEWMRRYTEEPERFENEWTRVAAQYREDVAAGRVPTYGDLCARQLQEILRELREAGLALTAE
jgi:hypothetical protein